VATVTADLFAGLPVSATEETYDKGVRKVVFRDPDGNEVGFGGGPPQ
jgi:hypothetical protein